MPNKALPPALQRLISALTMLPGIGEKSATRLALSILRWPESKARELGDSILHLHSKIRLCSTCLTFSEADPCAICGDPRRDQSVICVVEDPGDIVAIEKSDIFKGVYHVLHGSISPMDGIGPDDIKIKQLMDRLRPNDEDGGRPLVEEVIIATSSTASGEATATYLSDILRRINIKTTRLACGIPVGMDIKYADPLTLKQALSYRVSV